MFFVRVVGVTEIIVDRDGFDDAGNGFGAEGGDTGCDQCRTDAEVLAQFVVERAYRLPVFIRRRNENGLLISRLASDVTQATRS